MRTNVFARGLALLIGLSSSATLWAEFPVPSQANQRTVVRKIQPDVRYQFSRSVGAGRLVLQTKGTAGEIRTTYAIAMKNGREVARTPLFSTKTPSTPTTYLIGRGGFTPSRGSFSGGKILTMESTAYDPYPPGGSGTGKTATGIQARFGIAAVDPRVIKLGTVLFVEGYGFALAADTGGAIRGNKIDLCFNTRAEAYRWGRKKVRVHILGAHEPSRSRRP